MKLVINYNRIIGAILVLSAILMLDYTENNAFAILIAVVITALGVLLLLNGSLRKK